MSIQKEIIKWYKLNKRDLPWRNNTDAYTIWLSEIILQQTRVEQGLPYFNKFLENYYDRYTGIYLKSKDFLTQLREKY